MKKRPSICRPLALVFLLSGALATSSCSTGTKDGDVSVEEGKYKDKNPTEHNAGVQGQPSTDTTANMAEPYERAEKATDKDVDGKADAPAQE